MVDPAALTDGLRRNDAAVLVGGRLAWERGAPGSALGRQKLGAVLRAG